MSKEKQILHMLLDGYSQRRIASTLCVSRNTVAKVARAASDHQLSKDALESMEEMEIHNTLFPEEALLPTLVTPDLVFFASTFSSKMQIEFLKVAWGISPVLHFLRRHSFRCRRGAVAGIQSLLVTDM